MSYRKINFLNTFFLTLISIVQQKEFNNHRHELKIVSFSQGSFIMENDQGSESSKISVPLFSTVNW